MKLHIIARGKLGRGAEAEIIARYAKRISWPFAISELPDVGGKSPAALVPAIIVALDETGALLSSAELADKIVHWRDTGIRECRFLIGAADGLSDEARASADLLLSFGRATFPHLLVRVMLVEQLYRAITIIDGHPYHRAG